MDFSKAILDKSNKALFAIVLGPSGAGKSYSIGSLPGKTLMFLTNGDQHGGQAALTGGCTDLVPVSVDLMGDTPDARYVALKDALSKADKMEFDNIVIDSCAGLEELVSSTRAWANDCLDGVKHNKFKESEVTLRMINTLIRSLFKAHAAGKNVVFTGIADIISKSEKTGEITEAKPRGRTFGIIEGIIQNFQDVLLVSPMMVGGETRFMFQMGTTMKSAQKDGAMVKRLLNFQPRIAGVKLNRDNIDASLSDILKMREEVK